MEMIKKMYLHRRLKSKEISICDYWFLISKLDCLVFIILAISFIKLACENNLVQEDKSL